ncbi:hypothetical protein FDH38_gp054 [Dinoroseobacter phage vB_DshS-R5C]|uniref:Uncharacterized protein n=1 Tax=Dinoroseobacter phage vB_DshS-R5C TaxID=1965368 RepID=A0A1V0DYA0_9CAUD|nr:hypothetical protein FDH38_gp054 [Dinoroseobacter phage vB_DshS-R5C]ARB06108.1 hypothetical protein vBDshSR5C_54 [Dinoroseobacter phage vB_DshS-R5C]
MSDRNSRQLSFILSLPTLFLLITLGFIPVMFPIMAQWEGNLMPVVRNVEVREVENTETGIIVDVHFDKVRSCEFLGISWYDSFGDRAPCYSTSTMRAISRGRDLSWRTRMRARGSCLGSTSSTDWLRSRHIAAIRSGSLTRDSILERD